MENIIENLLNLEVGHSIDIKFFLISRDVLRVSKKMYVITDTSSGWVKTKVNIETIKKLITGEVSFLELNWK